MEYDILVYMARLVEVICLYGRAIALRSSTRKADVRWTPVILFCAKKHQL